MVATSDTEARTKFRLSTRAQAYRILLQADELDEKTVESMKRRLSVTSEELLKSSPAGT